MTTTPPVSPVRAAELADELRRLAKQIVGNADRLHKDQPDASDATTITQGADMLDSIATALSRAPGDATALICVLRTSALTNTFSAYHSHVGQWMNSAADLLQTQSLALAQRDAEVADERETKEYEAKRHDYWKARAEAAEASEARLRDLLQRAVDELDCTEQRYAEHPKYAIIRDIKAALAPTASGATPVEGEDEKP